MQIDGEIIIWSTFWQCLSSLLSGLKLDDLIISVSSSSPSSLHQQQPTSSDSTTYPKPSTTLSSSSSWGTNNYNNGDNYVTNYNNNSDNRQLVRSDSDLARQLQAELDNEVNFGNTTTNNYYFY